jgi:hypothetical protein
MQENKEENWETQEVINWLINDEYAYGALYNKSARYIEQWVKEENAPQGLYEAFNAPPQSSFRDVDWNAVEEALAEEE